MEPTNEVAGSTESMLAQQAVGTQSQQQTMTEPGLLDKLQDFFASWRFPVLALSIVGSYELLLLVLLVFPQGAGEMSTFADEFRTWCFGYDPATGKMQWVFVFTTLAAPLVLILVTSLTWYQPLRQILKQRPLVFLPYFFVCLLFSTGSAALLTTLQGEVNQGELPFPAESLRTDFAAPDFTLINQDGETVSLAEHRGKVLLLTAVYSTCGFT